MSEFKERYEVSRNDEGQWETWYTPTWRLVGTYGNPDEAWRAAELDEADCASLMEDWEL